MYKYLLLIVASTALHADADFCEEEKPCDEKAYYCPFCTNTYGVEDEVEQLKRVTGWPSRNIDPFMDALSR